MGNYTVKGSDDVCAREGHNAHAFSAAESEFGGDVGLQGECGATADTYTQPVNDAAEMRGNTTCLVCPTERLGTGPRHTHCSTGTCGLLL